jgi:predicted dithiol-disulfide oxidoreductase (DUF899 family)
MTEHKGTNARRVGGGPHAHGQLLDRTPKGRGDDRRGWPRRRDEYANDQRSL